MELLSTLVSLEILSAIISIVVVDLTLSGDNAIVIGMAAHSLPHRQRRFAIIFGGAAAIVLRIANTAVASQLLLLPALKAIGGVVLVWIAFKLLREEEEHHEEGKVAASFWAAIWTILVADFVMSLDNILTVAAISRGNVALLAFGLLLSMAILMFAGSIVAEMINRMWWLVYVGSALVAWFGAGMVLEDDLVHPWTQQVAPQAINLIVPALTVLLVVALSHWFHRRAPRKTAVRPAAGVVGSDTAPDGHGR